MPIRINLLAEVQAAEETRRRDPVKRAIWVCGLLILALLAWSGQLFFKLQSTQKEADTQESIWKKNEGPFKLITDSQKEMIETERKLDALVRFTTNRFLWAPVLNGLQQAIAPVSDDIQLEHFRGLQSYEQVPATPASKDKKVAAKPAAAIERVVFVLRARDFGNPNEANYNRFKTTLNGQAYLKTLLPKSEGVRLAGALAGPQPDPSDPSRTFYQFSLECRLMEVRRDE